MLKEKSTHKYITKFLLFFDYEPEEKCYILVHPGICSIELMVTLAYVIGSIIISFTSGLTVSGWIATILFSFRAVLRQIRSADDAKRAAVKKHGTTNITHPKKNLLIGLLLTIFISYFIFGAFHHIFKVPSEFRFVYNLTFIADKIVFLVLELIELGTYTSCALVIPQQKLYNT